MKVIFIKFITNSYLILGEMFNREKYHLFESSIKYGKTLLSTLDDKPPTSYQSVYHENIIYCSNFKSQLISIEKGYPKQVKISNCVGLAIHYSKKKMYALDCKEESWKLFKFDLCQESFINIWKEVMDFGPQRGEITEYKRLKIDGYRIHVHLNESIKILQIDKSTEEITEIRSIIFKPNKKLIQIESYYNEYWIGLESTPFSFKLYKESEENNLQECESISILPDSSYMSGSSFVIDKSTDYIHICHSSYLTSYYIDLFSSGKMITKYAQCFNNGGNAFQKMIKVNLSSYSTSIIFLIDSSLKLVPYIHSKEFNGYKLILGNMQLKVKVGANHFITNRVQNQYSSNHYGSRQYSLNPYKDTQLYEYKVPTSFQVTKNLELLFDYDSLIIRHTNNLQCIKIDVN